jgi:hypothetical protein
MDWLWTFVSSVAALHVLALLLYLNWTRRASGQAADRMQHLVASFAQRQKDQ